MIQVIIATVVAAILIMIIKEWMIPLFPKTKQEAALKSELEEVTQLKDEVEMMAELKRMREEINSKIENIYNAPKTDEPPVVDDTTTNETQPK